jgi:tripartite ATP-independent transporter DctM subunit
MTPGRERPAVADRLVWEGGAAEATAPLPEEQTRKEAAVLRKVARGIENGIRVVSEAGAAALVTVEVVVLLIGVSTRYFFGHPMVWTDELASILFLWLCLLGGVLALQRNEHMKLATLVSWMPPPWQQRMQTFALLVMTLFLAEILPTTFGYAESEWAILTPALQMHDTFRVGAIVVGVMLMLILCVCRLLQQARLVDVLSSAVVLGLVVGALSLGRPVLMQMGTYNLLVFFVLFVAVAVSASVAIFVAFGLSTFAYLATVTHVPLLIVVSRMDDGMSNLVLLAVPLFVFLGLLIEMTGLAKAMIDFLAALLGHVRGGLSYVLLGAMYLVSGISGAKVADMAAVAPALFPEMERRGSERGELIALLSASGAMTDTIPPSLFLITLGSVCGVSIAGLFTGGLLPALLLAACLCTVVYFKTRNEDLTGVRRHPVKEIIRLGLISAPALILPFLIRWAVVFGVATATEVSTLGIAYTIVAGILIYRQFPLRRLYPALIETASLAGAILLIIGAATAMAWALTQSGMSQKLVMAVQAAPGGKAMFLTLSIAAFAVLGSVLEGIPSIVLFGPLLFPVSRALGINDIHYSMVIIVAMGLGLFAPPFGVGFYGACAVGRGVPDVAMRRIWIYLLALLLGLVILAAVPEISTCLL